MMMGLMNVTQDKPIVQTVAEAKSFAARIRGLIGRPSISENETLWFDNCTSIHTFFMSFPIDVVFVDKNFKVKAVYETLHPWRMTLPVWGAKSVFEFKAGKIKQTQIKVGDQLHVVPENT
jgi:uncharacterized protein